MNKEILYGILAFLITAIFFLLFYMIYRTNPEKSLIVAHFISWILGFTAVGLLIWGIIRQL
jgi:hypothetical protein